ncbi:MAG: hypothetical protein QHH05_08260, partial [Syntrophomonadaceae bacterium]|nr:hypothetical protein [Syntrophomonadaceae bacterium]
APDHEPLDEAVTSLLLGRLRQADPPGHSEARHFLQELVGRLGAMEAGPRTPRGAHIIEFKGGLRRVPGLGEE